MTRNAQYQIALPLEYTSIFDVVELALIEVQRAGRLPKKIHLCPRDYKKIVEEARECVGKIYYGRKDIALKHEQFNGVDIIEETGEVSFIVTVEKKVEINPTPGKLVNVDSPSRQDWQGATDDEINAAIKDCNLSLSLFDGPHREAMTNINAVKATLLWVMDAVKNPHPLE